MNPLKKNSTILVLAPHTDDGELGMGGAISRFIEEGKTIHYAAFSTADKSLPKEFPPGTLSSELMDATKTLGIPAENVHLFDYEVRTFSYYRQEILEDIVKLKKEISPDTVFSPTIRDLHQDHLVIANEGLRAFKKVNYLSYEMPWNNLNFNTSTFIELAERHVTNKINALKSYKSQASKDYVSKDFIFGLAKTRGVQIGVPFAEAFETMRIINRIG